MKSLILATATVATVVVSGCSRPSQAAPLQQDYVGVCVHLSSPYSTYECDDLMLLSTDSAGAIRYASVLPLPQVGTTRPPSLKADQIKSVTIVVETQANNTYSYTFNKKVDALFFGKKVSRGILAYYYDQSGDRGKGDGVRNATQTWPDEP